MTHSERESVRPPAGALTPLKRKGTDSAESCMERARREEEEEAHAHQQMNKSQHHVVVAAWLVASFGQCFLRRGAVVDVAGGLGKLDHELAVRYGVRSILIDPRFSEKTSEQGEESRSNLQLSSMLRRKMKKITKSRLSGASDSIAQDKSPLMKSVLASRIIPEDDGYVLPQVKRCISNEIDLPFEHITASFPLHCEDILSQNSLCKILSEASMIVGIHPDQVTDAIVDIAIHFRVPFAVIPCCVFSKMFPSRRLKSGGEVRSYTDLISYLMEKHKNIQQDTLPFAGRNAVLYCSDYS